MTYTLIGGQDATDTSAPIHLLVPAYSYPSPTTFWDAMTAGAPTVAYMIANPASGPGTTTDPNYTAAIANAQNAGIRILGYVPTGFAATATATVEANVDLWFTLYGVRDIFFDEVTGNIGDIAYYTTLCDYVHGAAAGSQTVLNPGVVPDESYMAIGDIVVVFEDVEANYAAFSPPAWVTDGTYPSTRFCNIVHTTAADTNLATNLAKAVAENAGYIYFTDDVMANPYDVLPTYLASELSTAPANTVTVTYPGATTAGDLLVATVSVTGAGIGSVTIPGWSVAIQDFYHTGQTGAVAILIKIAIGTESVVTATVAATTISSIEIAIHEFDATPSMAGTPIEAFVDQTTHKFTNSPVTSETLPSITPAATGDLILVAVGSMSPVSGQAISGLTMMASTARLADGYLVDSTTAPIAPTASWTGAAFAATVEVALLATAGLVLPFSQININAQPVIAGVATVPTVTLVGLETEWSVRAVNIAGTIHAVYPTAEVLTITETVNAPTEATFTVPIDAAGLGQLTLEGSEVQLWRNGHLMFWGPVTTRRASSTDRVWTYTAKDPLWYLLARNIGQASRVNFLANGSFETGLGSWTNHGVSTVAADPANSVLGGQSLAMICGSTGENYMNQVIYESDTTATGYGLDFYLTAWCYIDAFIAPAGFGAGMLIQILGSPFPIAQSTVVIDETTPRNTWVRLSAKVHAPGHAPAFIEVRLYCPNGAIHWDGVTLTASQALTFNREQTEIATEVVNYLQGKGGFSTFHSISNGKSDLNVRVNNLPLSGIHKSRVYQEADHQPGYQGGTSGGVLDDFAVADDGFDFRVDVTATTRTFQTYYPRVGTAHTDFRLEWVRNAGDGDGPSSQYGIIGWDIGESIESPCANNVVELSGWGDGPDREEGGYSNPSTLNGLTLELVESVPSNTPIDALNAIAQRRGRLLQNPIVTPTLTVAEPRDPTTGSVIHPLIGVIRAGDSVPVVLIDGDVEIVRTVRFVQVTYDAQQETLALVPNTPE